MASEGSFSVALDITAHSNFLLRVGDVNLLQPADIHHLLFAPISLPSMTGIVLFCSKRLPGSLAAADTAGVLHPVVMAYR